MGGNVPGHHGVGITSGMRYNKGGSVKPGPDGRNRLHAKVGGGVIGGLVNAALYGIPYAKQAIQGISKYGKDYFKYSDDALKKIDDYNPLFSSKPGYDRKAVAKILGLKRNRGIGQAMKGAQLLGPAVPLAGAASAYFDDPDRDKTYLEKGANIITEGALDFSALGAGKFLLDAATTKESEEFNPQTISSAIKGINPGGKTDTSDILDENVPGIVERISAEDQLRQDFAQRKALYEELMSSSDEGQNNLGVLGRSLLEASEALNQGQGYVSAGNVFGTGIADEVARRDERTSSIRDAAATQAITDVMSEQALDQATMNEMLLSGDVEGIRTKKGLDQAQAAGIPLEKVPTDDGGELDKESLDERTGTVFIDPDNVVGKGFFVAVNSKGEKASFNDVQAAIEFAET